MWGFWEGANWIPASSLYKRDWTPTPAAEAYQKLIYKHGGRTGRAEWVKMATARYRPFMAVTRLRWEIASEAWSELTKDKKSLRVEW